MVTWNFFRGRPQAWDELNAGLQGSFFQTEAWARHKKNLGWDCLRAVGMENGSPAAAAQFLLKRYPAGACLLWARGGPGGEPKNWDAGLRRAVTDAARSRLLYGRFCSYQARSPEKETALAEHGWQRPPSPLNRPFTFILDMGAGEADLRAGLSQNWAHNLRRGLKRCRVRRWRDAHAEDLLAVYRNMEAYKGLATQHGREELASLLAHLGENLVLYRADDESGSACALRACAVWEGRAWDLLAASSASGRKNYASYILLWSLLQEARAGGATQYDLGGADAAAAPGVFDFKKGTGARPVDYLGEWDWASPGWLRPWAARVLSLKAGA